MNTVLSVPFTMEESREKLPRAFKLCTSDKGPKNQRSLLTSICFTMWWAHVFNVSSPDSDTVEMSPNDLQKKKT